MIHNTYSQRGQALLITVLLMTVALTIGLALMSRTTTDIQISQQQEESARAFSAAEAGIEEALRSGGIIGGSVTLDSGASYTSTSTAVGRADFTFPDEIDPGDAVTLWLNGHDGSGNFIETSPYGGSSFNLCWGAGAVGEVPAVEVSVYYKSGGQYLVSRSAYDADRGRGNGFADVDSGGCLDLTYKKAISLPAGVLLFVNIKPFYSTAKIGAEGVGANFPSQGQEIESIGALGEITRKVRVFRSWPAPAAVFDYGLFSGSGLVK